MILVHSSPKSGLILCYVVDFYYRSGGDGGWGCGFKNIQTLCSALLRHRSLRDAMFEGNAWAFVVVLQPAPARLVGQGFVPSIPVLQSHIDYAHAQGYDPGAQIG